MVLPSNFKKLHFFKEFIKKLLKKITLFLWVMINGKFTILNGDYYTNLIQEICDIFEERGNMNDNTYADHLKNKIIDGLEQYEGQSPATYLKKYY